MYDRITDILTKRAAQPTTVSNNEYEALRFANLFNPSQFGQQADALEQRRQNEPLQAEMDLMKVMEAKRAAGDRQADLLDRRIKMFTGEDPQGYAMFLNELHNDPEEIDPSNSYQLLTKLSGIQKKTGYTSPELAAKKELAQLELEGKRLGLEKDRSAISLNQARAGKASAEAKKALLPPEKTMTSQKAPYGYRWAEDGVTLEPIPGGPAEEIPGELAARLGLANKFLGEVEGLKKQVKSGKATGIVDYTQGAAGYGESGKIQRRIDDGADSLQRMLTGAGMPQSEADEYAARFRATPGDTAATLTDKLENLEKDLKNVVSAAMRGRGGSSSISIPPMDDSGWSIEEVE